jgi:hypothetical protein
MAIVQAKWFEKQFGKIRRSFLWAGKMETSGGHCLIHWDTVCRPSIYGGLGMSNLHLVSRALWVRWEWQQHTFPDKPWHACAAVSH